MLPLFKSKTPFSSSQRISVFPNPVGNELTLFGGDQLIGEKLIVYDSYGKIIIDQRVLGSEFKLQVANLLPGVYYLKIKNTIQKMVKS